MNGSMWKRSLPSLVLVALLNSDVDVVAAEQSNKKPTAPPTMESPAAGTNKWSGVHKVRQKLERIVFNDVRYDGLPLGEVIRQLIEESNRRDPEKLGINFLLINNAPTTVIDPATGLPISQDQVDLSSTTVRIDPPLKNVRLVDVLDAIVKVADRPLRYAINDYGVIFSVDPAPGFTEPLTTETFQVQADIFFKGIESAFGIDVPIDISRSHPAGSGQTPRSATIQLWSLKLKQAEEALQTLRNKYQDTHPEVVRAEKEAEAARAQVAREQDAQAQSMARLPNRETQQHIFRELFGQLGVRLDPPKTAFFNELTGILMVRVHPNEMEAVRAAIETLGGTPTVKPAQ
jgi:hypothetical protein